MGVRTSETEGNIGQIAIRKELLNKKQVRHCMDVFNKRKGTDKESPLGEIMVELGYLTAPQLTMVRSESRRRRCAIHGYEIIEEVGRGNVGVVYRARQVKMERDVALKILSPSLSEREEVIKEYIKEARAVARLNHPHIVQGIDVGQSNGFYFFAMEFLPGGDLAGVLEKEGPLDAEQILIYMYQACLALDHAWKNEIIHCDIKPANLMLDDKGGLKVTDLGLAQVGEVARSSESGRRIVRGTPHYISPEQVETPGCADCRSDLYSLAVTFYHLASGRPPFDGADKKDIMLARLKTIPENLKTFRPDFPDGLVHLIHRMMSRDPDDRPQTPSEVVEELVKLGVNVSATGDLAGAIRRTQSKRIIPAKTTRGKTGATRAGRKKKKSDNLMWYGLGVIGIVALLALAICMIVLA